MSLNYEQNENDILNKLLPEYRQHSVQRKAIQKQLQDTLEKVKLSNEIISSIARTYQYISRIDIQADYFEEINNRDTEHLKFTKSGKLSESNERYADNTWRRSIRRHFQICGSEDPAGTHEE